MNFEKKIICHQSTQNSFQFKKKNSKNAKFTSNYVGRTRQIFKKIITAIKKLIKKKYLKKKYRKICSSIFSVLQTISQNGLRK